MSAGTVTAPDEVVTHAHLRLLELPDAYVVATPLGDRLRIAGTMEFDGTTDRFRPERIQAVVRRLGQCFAMSIYPTARRNGWDLVP